MALTKTSTAMTWASGSATASGTTNAVDISGSYAGEVSVQVVTVGTATTAASFTVEFSADGTNFRSSVGPFSPSALTAATYKLPPIQCPPGMPAVRVVYTAQAGGTSSTLTADVTRITAL